MGGGGGGHPAPPHPFILQICVISYNGMAIYSLLNFSRYTGLLYGPTALPFFSELIIILISSVVTGEIKKE